MPTGNVSFDSSPQGTTICMDGQPMLDSLGMTIRTPVIVTDIPIGPHRFVFHVPGFYREEAMVNIIEGQTVDIFATLTPKW